MKKVLSLILLVSFVVSMTGCSLIPAGNGGEGPDEPTTQNEKNSFYNEIIEEYYYVIKYADSQTDEKEGFTGAIEVGQYLGEDALGTLGYLFKDLNGDGEDELLIGESGSEEGAYTKNTLYAVYTPVDGVPELVLEGRSRNSYALMKKDEIFNCGSNGAAYRIFGTYKLDKNGELACNNFNFSYEKNGNYEDIGFFHNTTGVYEVEQAREMNIDYEKFEKMEQDLADKTVELKFTPFSQFTPSGDGEKYKGKTGEEKVLQEIGGSWSCLLDWQGYNLVLDIEIKDGGRASYYCGYYQSEYVGMYDGTWTCSDDGTTIHFDLVDSLEGDSFVGDFIWSIEGGRLSLLHTSGDALIYDKQHTSLSFSRK